MADKSKQRDPSLFDFLDESPLALLSADEIYQQADADLIRRLKEDRRLERKPAGIHCDDLGGYLSMWANSPPEGGLIVVGIEDDGEFSGCAKLTPERINDLEAVGHIFCPDARYQSKRIPVTSSKGKPDFLVLFRVAYRQDKLVRTNRNKAYIRRGDRRVKLSEEERREIEIDKGQLPLELEPCNLRYPADFDQNLIQQFVENFRAARDLSDHHGDADILELCRLVKRTKQGVIPNIACALLFAEQPRNIVPGCYVRFLRIDGEVEGTGDKLNYTKDIFIEGQVPRIIAEVERVLDAQLREFSRLGPDGKFCVAPEYPKFAWYEAIVNACVHRSYGLKNMNIFVKMFDDRLVIESPGPFPPLVSPENIYETHHPRNPNLMGAMYYLKFVKCAHEGTRRMKEQMQQMSLPAPEFAHWVSENRGGVGSAPRLLIGHDTQALRDGRDRCPVGVPGATPPEIQVRHPQGRPAPGRPAGGAERYLLPPPGWVVVGTAPARLPPLQDGVPLLRRVAEGRGVGPGPRPPPGGGPAGGRAPA